MHNRFYERVHCNHGKKCPKCSETTDIDQQNGIWLPIPVESDRQPHGIRAVFA